METGQTATWTVTTSCAWLICRGFFLTSTLNFGCHPLKNTQIYTFHSHALLLPLPRAARKSIWHDFSPAWFCSARTKAERPSRFTIAPFLFFALLPRAEFFSFFSPFSRRNGSP
ncbi:hypothetical protein BCV70DRAFT_63702 [Testicularia cyperi]|uniref:Uncharacterized protein n=1 Tax=Testicularia cyperi TaxID=1882483 RepID=A0A317XVT9_9BASI|nr:hypothetical protein BCV70DRAFT_63702 [Testicularia cyperi]